MDNEIAGNSGKKAEFEKIREQNLRELEDFSLEKIKLENEKKNLQNTLAKVTEISKMSENEIFDYYCQKLVENNPESGLLKAKMAVNNFEHSNLNEILTELDAKHKEIIYSKRDLSEQFSKTELQVKSLENENNSQISEIIELSKNIEILKLDAENKGLERQNLEGENSKLENENRKLDLQIDDLHKKIEVINQKIKMNEMLKDLDIDELHILNKNSSSMNENIAGLIKKWETLE